MCLTNPQRNVMHNMINMQSYNHISQKNIWLSGQVFREIAVAKFHGNRSVLGVVIECGYLTAICCRNIPASHIL